MHPRPQMQYPGDGYDQLRRMDFPYCVHEALKELNLMVRADPHLNPSKPEAQCLVNEFIIFDGAASGRPRRMLGNIQNLQLLEVLSDFFSPPGPDGGRLSVLPDWAGQMAPMSGQQGSDRLQIARNAAFMALFHPGCARDGTRQRLQRMERYRCTGQDSAVDSAQRLAAAGRRVELLTGLVSLAVSTGNQTVLAAAAHWMKTLGCTSEPCLRLARALVEDHLLSAAPAPADQLPQLSDRFTVCLLTAVTQLYPDPRQRAPPAPLLAQILRWWESHPGPEPWPLPLSPLLWTSPDPDCCPLAGLWRWTVYSALETDGRLASLAKPMARLHFLLLECMLQLSAESAAPRRCSPWIPLLELVRITDELVMAGCDVTSHVPSGGKKLALDRMVQLFQVAYEGDALEGHTPATRHRDVLQAVLERLYPTRLLQIVLRKRRANLPPE